MIFLVSAAKEGLENRLSKKKWYTRLIRIIRSQLPTWIKMDTAIIFLDQPAMRTMNRLYHKQNRVTDILSFAYAETNNAKGEGELYLCIPQIRRQAQRYQCSFLNEFTRMLVHGFLHLQGYDHRQTQERKRMNTYADAILSQAKKERLC